MDYVEPVVAPIINEDDEWVLDPSIDPLLNIATFGWTEGKFFTSQI